MVIGSIFMQNQGGPNHIVLKSVQSLDIIFINRNRQHKKYMFILYSCPNSILLESISPTLGPILLDISWTFPSLLKALLRIQCYLTWYQSQGVPLRHMSSGLNTLENMWASSLHWGNQGHTWLDLDLFSSICYHISHIP